MDSFLLYLQWPGCHADGCYVKTADDVRQFVCLLGQGLLRKIIESRVSRAELQSSSSQSLIYEPLFFLQKSPDSTQPAKFEQWRVTSNPAPGDILPPPAPRNAHSPYPANQHRTYPIRVEDIWMTSFGLANSRNKFMVEIEVRIPPQSSRS